MEIVPIPPISLIDHACTYSRMQFCLVHELENRNESLWFYSDGVSSYQTAYERIGAHPDYYLIMDNGAFELGASKALDLVLKWIEIIKPDEIVLPDRMFMADETLRMSEDSLNHILPAIQRTDKDIKLQGVVHGRNHGEWLECAKEMSNFVDVLAIPKDYEAWSGGRELLSYSIEGLGKPIHLLGMEADPWTVLRWKKRSHVRSIDTAKPYINASYANFLFPHWGSFIKRPRPTGYFDLTFDEVELKCANTNMTQWKALYA